MSLAVSLSVDHRASARRGGWKTKTERVLLISVDGLHALDVARYLDSHPYSDHEANWRGTASPISNARTPAEFGLLSGLLALVNRGSPVNERPLSMT